MTSSHHAPYGLGYTRTTMALNRGKRRSDPEQTPKTESQFGLQAATRLYEVGIASNRGSACRGDVYKRQMNITPDQKSCRLRSCMIGWLLFTACR